MRSLIIGGGAIGQFCAARLKQAGHDVVILARPEQAAAIGKQGIQLRVDSTVASVAVQAVSEIADSALDKAFDLVVVAVKSYSTEEVAETVAQLPACRGASILTVQNGLGNEEILAAAFSPDRIVAGALTVAVDRHDASSITATKRGGLSIAPVGADPHNWLLAALGPAIAVRAVNNWQALKWSKLLINILGNGVCAALDWPPEQVYGDRDAFAIERLCLTEALGVMSRLGLAPQDLINFPTTLLAAAARRLPAPILRVILSNRVARARGGKLPSLLMDLRARRPQTEVMALNGAVSRYAVRAGLQAPMNERIAEVVSGVAEGRLDWNDYRGRPERLISAT